MTKSKNVDAVLRNKGTAVNEGLAESLDSQTSAAAPADGGREERIREAAYAAAERRGFVPGYETEDWLEAERRIDSDRQQQA